MIACGDCIDGPPWTCNALTGMAMQRLHSRNPSGRQRRDISARTVLLACAASSILAIASLQAGFDGAFGCAFGGLGITRRFRGNRSVPRSAAVTEPQTYAESPIGMIKRQFEAQQLIKLRKSQKRLPAVTEIVSVMPHQVQRDIEQFEYLVDSKKLDPQLESFVTDVVLPDYRCMLNEVNAASEAVPSVPCKIRYSKHIGSYFGMYQRALYVHPGDTVSEALQPRDFEALERDFLQKEHRVSVIPDFFSQEALQQLRDYLMDSTFWLDRKKGYVGTYMHTGFACPLIAQIDREIRAKFPEVLRDMQFQNAWAFMYDGSTGVETHADDAQVQINVFLTPTEANLWSEDSSNPGGGLIIYGIGPPKERPMIDYNSEGGHPWIEELIASIGNFNVTAPYIQNQAIMFDSTYFHRTDEMKFKKGYKNRRINVTFLYGKRSNLIPAAVTTSHS